MRCSVAVAGCSVAWEAMVGRGGMVRSKVWKRSVASSMCCLVEKYGKVSSQKNK